jgi:signal transduction histidine kinase
MVQCTGGSDLFVSRSDRDWARRRDSAPDRSRSDDMSVTNSPGQLPPRTARRSVWFTFLAMVAVPAACLVLIWGVVAGAALGGAMALGRRELGDFLLLAAICLVIALASVALTGLFARRMTSDIAGLEATAQRLAAEQMPQLLERLRQGEQGVAEGAADPAATQPNAKTAEIARAEAAIASLQRTAVAAAAAEASMRNAISKVFVSLARRNQSLLQRQLLLIDALEQKAPDPATLADLFPLDHLTTRMRRHAEGLIILSGAPPGRSWSDPVPIIDVIRGAVAEVEDYKRVAVLIQSEDAVAGLAAADMIHLLAELIENATLSSPSGTRVEVRADRVANGFAIEVEDRGLGIEARRLQAINEQLAHPPDFDLANADQLGLFVVGKLAARHGVRVALRPSPYGGTSAVVLMPNSIVVPTNATDADTQPGLSSAAGRASLDLGHAGIPALTGRHAIQPSSSVGAAGHAGTPTTASLALGQAGLSPATRSSEPAALAAPAPGQGPPGFGTGSATTSPDLPTSSRGFSATGPGGPGPAVDAGGSPGTLVPGSRIARTYRGLPRRIRQVSLNPGLRDSSAAASPGTPADDTPPTDARTPEGARDFVASLQSGWQRGRETDPPEAESAPGGQPGGPQDSETPQGEGALWMSRARLGQGRI